MKRVLIILLLVCIPLLFLGFDNKSTMASIDVADFQDSIKEGLDKPFLSFNIGQSIKCREKVYTIYCYDTNEPILRKDISIKHINNIGLASMKKTNDITVKIIEQGDGQEINNLTSGIVPVGLYDKEYDFYVVGGKVIDFNGSNFAQQQIELKLKNGTILQSQINKDGYFLFIFKSINGNTLNSKKSMFTYGNEIEYIKTTDKKGNSIVANWK